MTCRYCAFVAGKVYQLHSPTTCLSCGHVFPSSSFQGEYIGLTPEGMHKFRNLSPWLCPCRTAQRFTSYRCGDGKRAAVKREEAPRKKPKGISLAERLFKVKVKEREDADV
jgi:hypothetical protein